MPALFPTPDKKLFSDLIALAGDFHTLELAYVKAKGGGSGPPELDQLVQAILQLKAQNSHPVDANVIPEEVGA